MLGDLQCSWPLADEDSSPVAIFAKPFEGATRSVALALDYNEHQKLVFGISQMPEANLISSAVAV